MAREKARQDSNSDDGRTALHWVVPLSEDLVYDLDELHRSREMVRRHEREKLTPEQQRLLHDRENAGRFIGRALGREAAPRLS